MSVGQVQCLQDKIYCDHGQYTGKQIHDNCGVHQRLTCRETHAGGRIGHHQYKSGGDHTYHTCNDEGVLEPVRELCHTVRREKQILILRQTPFLREKGAGIHAGVCAEGGDHQPYDRHQPDKCQKRQ